MRLELPPARETKGGHRRSWGGIKGQAVAFILSFPCSGKEC